MTANNNRKNNRSTHADARLHQGLKVLDNMYQAGLIANLVGAGFNLNRGEDRRDSRGA